MGINIEYEQADKRAVAGFLVASKILQLATGFKIEGEFPGTGAAIAVGNHTSTLNGFMAYLASIETGHRIARMVAKETLFHPGRKEPDEVLQRTGKENAFDPMTLPLIADTVAFTLRGIGGIPVYRGKNRNISRDRQFLKTCGEILDAEQFLGLFIQETRVKEGDLRDVFPGVGVLVREHKTTPVIPVAILSGKYGNKMVIGQSVTGQQLEEEAGHKLTSREMTARVVDKIADIHHPYVRAKWHHEDKPLLLRAA